MDKVDLDEEIRTRKGEVFRLKKEIEGLKQAKDIISGDFEEGETVEANEGEKGTDDDM